MNGLFIVIAVVLCVPLLYGLLSGRGTSRETQPNTAPSQPRPHWPSQDEQAEEQRTAVVVAAVLEQLRKQHRGRW